MNTVIVAILLMLSNGSMAGGFVTEGVEDCAAIASAGVAVNTDHPELLKGATLVCQGFLVDPEGNIVYNGQ